MRKGLCRVYIERQLRASTMFVRFTSVMYTRERSLLLRLWERSMLVHDLHVVVHIRDDILAFDASDSRHNPRMKKNDREQNP